MAHQTEAACLLETGALYDTRVMLRAAEGDPIFAGFKPGAASLYFGDEPSRRAFFEEVEGTTPLRAVGEPAEVASLVAFLCSPEASWMQGQVLYLDGGIFLHAPGHSVRWWRRTGRMS